MTPAAQITVRASTRSSPTETPLQSPSVTPPPRRTSTPIFSSASLAAADKEASNGVSKRGAASTRIHSPPAGRSRGIRCQRPLRQFGHRAGHFDAGRAAADNYEIQQSASLLRVGLGLGFFECQENAPAQISRVVDRLEAGSERSPFLMTEVSVLRTGRDDEGVEPNAMIFGNHLATVEIYAGNIGQDDAHILFAGA